MSLQDEIFPPDRDPDLVQTEWAEGWFGGASGFGYAAEYLTKNRRSLGATIDQAGLAVFFLQRHRVEMLLKALLDAIGADVAGTHSLGHLWSLCEQKLRPKDSQAWNDFASRHRELVNLLDGVDPSSFAFRYPVDKQGQRIPRPAYIDLAKLNEHVQELHYAIFGYLEYVS